MNNLGSWIFYVDWIVFVKDVLIPIVQGVVTITALCIGSYVGIVGLNTWKEELHAKNNYELYRRTMIAVYKVREAIQNARQEVWGEPSVLGLTLDEVDEIEEEVMKGIADAQIEIDNLKVELFEVEVEWGNMVRNKIDNINSYADKITQAMTTLKSLLKEEESELSEGSAPRSNEQLEIESCLDILYKGAESKFSKNLRDEVDEIETMLKRDVKI